MKKKKKYRKSAIDYFQVELGIISQFVFLHGLVFTKLYKQGGIYFIAYMLLDCLYI